MKMPFCFLLIFCAFLLPNFISAQDVTSFALTPEDVSAVTIQMAPQQGLQPRTRLVVAMSAAKLEELRQNIGKRINVMVSGQVIADIDLNERAAKRYLSIIYLSPDEALAAAKLLMPNPLLGENPFVSPEPSDALVFALTAEDVLGTTLSMSQTEALKIEISHTKEKLSELAQLSSTSLSEKRKVRITLLGKAVEEIGPYRRAISDHVEVGNPSFKVLYHSVDDAFVTARDLVNRLQ